MKEKSCLIFKSVYQILYSISKNSFFLVILTVLRLYPECTCCVPSSLVPGALVPSSPTCTCRDPPPACSPVERRGMKKQHVGRKEPADASHLYLMLHLASVRNVNVDHVHLLPGLRVQAVHLKQSAVRHTWQTLWISNHTTLAAVPVAVTFSRCPMSGLCHVSILIKKLSFMYSFCRKKWKWSERISG